MSPQKRIVAMLLVAFTVMIAGLTVVSPASAATRSTVLQLGGPYQIRPTGSGKCLDVEGVSYDNGAYLQLYDCLGQSQYNQWFYFFLKPGTVADYQIKASHSWKCLDIEGVSLSAGARVQQYDCLGWSQANQIFRVIDYGAFITFAPTHSQQGVTYQGLFNGAAVFQYPGTSTHWTPI